jgi:hypothetical protein
MYQFKVRELESGEYRLELGDIRILVDDYTVENNAHFISHPQKAVAYFTVEDNLYSISNEHTGCRTAEDLFDTICRQYSVFADRVGATTTHVKH